LPESLETISQREDGLSTLGTYAWKPPKIDERGLIQIDGIVRRRPTPCRHVARVDRRRHRGR
jgi:hypothetical protein